MTIRQLETAILALGLHFSYSQTGHNAYEFRITFMRHDARLSLAPSSPPDAKRQTDAERQEAVAYYTSDSEDALATARYMANIKGQ